MEAYTNEENATEFIPLMKIKINEITLREMMLI